VVRGQALTFAALATDEDVPANSLTFSLDPASVDLGMTIATLTGDFSWTPREAQGPNSYEVAITVTDSGSPPKTDVEVFTITVFWWQNPVHFADVNADGNITPDDVVLLVNDINAKDSRSLLTTSPRTPNPPPFLDPSGDGVISPLDALLVISYINSHASGPVPSLSGEEGEYALPLGGQGETLELTRVVSRNLEFASPSDPVVTSPCAPCRQLPGWPVACQRASSMRSGVTGSRRVSGRLPAVEFETRELEEAISEIAGHVADAWIAAT